MSYALEIETGKWKDKEKIPPLNTHRIMHSSCVVKDKVYVVGGMTIF